MRLSRLAPVLFSGGLILIAVYCGNTRSSTQELLDGTALAKIYRPISLLSPSDSTPLYALPTLSWSNASPISNYRVQISALRDFSTLIVDKVISSEAYTVLQSDLIGITAFDGREYYWRVAGAANNVLMSSTGKLQFAETNVIYVNANTTSSTQSGNRTSPFKTISAGLGAADSRRGGNLNTAYTVRVAAGTYTEEITMIPGISLRGGFGVAASTGSTPAGAASTDWARDITANVSTIQAPLNVAVNCNSNITAAYQATTVLDGFTLTGGSSKSLANMGIYINDSNPIIQNNIITGSTTTSISVSFSYAYGIFISSATVGSSSALIQNNQIQASTAAIANVTSYGIYLRQSATPTIRNNFVHGGFTTGNPAIAIEINVAAPTITNNVIYGGTSISGSTIGIEIFSAGIGSISIANNTINGGNSGTGSAFGVTHVTVTSLITETNNIIFTTAGATQRIGVWENGTVNVNPDTFINNLIFDSITALYMENATAYTTMSLGKPGGVNVATTTTSGNITAAATASVFASGYSVTNYSSWVILSGGAADIGGSAGWSGLGMDIGADAANAGPK